MSPRAGLDGCRKPSPHRDSIPGPSVPWPEAILTAPSLPTLNFKYLCKKETCLRYRHVLLCTCIVLKENRKELATYLSIEERLRNQCMLRILGVCL